MKYKVFDMYVEVGKNKGEYHYFKLSEFYKIHKILSEGNEIKLRLRNVTKETYIKIFSKQDP